MFSASPKQVPAGFARRAGALVFDLVTLAIGNVIGYFALAAVMAFAWSELSGEFYARSCVVFGVGLTLLYMVVLPARAGMTFGKDLLAIYIVGMRGEQVDFGSSVVRNLDLVICALGFALTMVTLDIGSIELIGYSFLSFVAFRLLDAAAVALTYDGRGIRDRIAGTMVVRDS